MARVTFDLDVLRSFAAGMALGSYAKAADRLGRSTSAVSAQLRKLEEQAGTPIFRKAGRGLALTPAGETMLAYARRLLALNDEAAAAVRGADLEGWVRLGLQEDFGESLLPDVLGRFARAHPKLRIEARVCRNGELIERVAAGGLDLALAWGEAPGVPGERLAEMPMRWIGPAAAPWPGDSPLPLAAFEAPCLFRESPIAALDHAGIAWRLVFTSSNLGALYAAIAAGLGIGIRSELGLPAGVRALEPGEAGLPPLPVLPLTLHRAKPDLDVPAARLAAMVADAVHGIAAGAAGAVMRPVAEAA